MPNQFAGNNPEMGKINKPCNYGPGCTKKATCRFDHGDGGNINPHKVTMVKPDFQTGGGGFGMKGQCNEFR